MKNCQDGKIFLDRARNLSPDGSHPLYLYPRSENLSKAPPFLLLSFSSHSCSSSAKQSSVFYAHVSPLLTPMISLPLKFSHTNVSPPILAISFSLSVSLSDRQINAGCTVYPPTK